MDAEDLAAVPDALLAEQDPARIAEDDDLSGIKVRRMGYAPTTCPTTPWLEEHFYPNPATIATLAHGLARPGAATWTPDPARAKLAYQTQFRGPF